MGLSHAQGKRDRSNKEYFGSHFLTARWGISGLSGWQITCVNPRHRASLICSREMANSVSGSSDLTRHILKAWALMGQGLASRDDHCCPQLRSSLIAAGKSGLLFSDTELDALAIIDWESEVVVPFRPADSVGVTAVQADAPDILDGASDMVPPEIHAAMLEMARECALPRTTRTMRAINSLSGQYRCPEVFEQALQYGYIHPNFAHPNGFVWKASPGVFRLCPRGG